MLHELRIYTFKVGAMPKYLKLVEEVGSKIRGDDYGIREGGWMTEFGTLNQFWHIWRHDSLDDWKKNRAGLAQNKAWMNDFVAQVLPLLTAQKVAFLDPKRDIMPPAKEGGIYEMRYYRCHLGKAPEFINAITDMFPVREKYSKNVCLWQSQSPDPHEVYHLWNYDSFNDRMAARAATTKDPEWQAFLAKGPSRLEVMNAIALIPAPFSKLK
ncbi:MAG: NIPSNAP family protein [Alphaproteobacteria bacterium]